MANSFMDNELFELFLFETGQLIGQIEQALLIGEQTSAYPPELIHEILRAMHTIKGSAATMKIDPIARLAHSFEDVFHFLREHPSVQFDYSELTDLLLDSCDFVKAELVKLETGKTETGDAGPFIAKINRLLEEMQRGDSDGAAHDVGPPAGEAGSYHAVFRFYGDAGMENVRAMMVLGHLEPLAEQIRHKPDEITAEESADAIREHGFHVWFASRATERELHQAINRISQLESYELVPTAAGRKPDGPSGRSETDPEQVQADMPGSGAFDERPSGGRLFDEPSAGRPAGTDSSDGQSSNEQSSDEQPSDKQPSGGQHAADAGDLIRLSRRMISVDVAKLDKLMDLVGELVISEAMVTQNPDLAGLQLDNFMKSARQLRKITGEIQEMVMSIRMVPLAPTFQNMHRLVRDMGKKLNKDVRLSIVGGDTEVDKTIIEKITDPIMHIIRNAVDHGIEPPDVRLAKGKPAAGRIVLEAKNTGRDVLIEIRDDGAGMDRDRILQKARENGIWRDAGQPMTDRDLFSLVFHPGFSTKERISEFSGRGVGMDVVARNIESIGGSVWIESGQDSGTSVFFNIPLTLAIMEGMNIRVGSACYTIPLTAIRESFRATGHDIIRDLDGNEMILARGVICPVIRLHETFNVADACTDLTSGIFPISAIPY